MSRHETALHQWLRITDAIAHRGMPAPASVTVYDGTDPAGPTDVVTVELHTPADAAAWAEHLGLPARPSDPWVSLHDGQIAGFWWSVRCMTDRSARVRVARPQADEVGV